MRTRTITITIEETETGDKVIVSAPEFNVLELIGLFGGIKDKYVRRFNSGNDKND